MGCVCCLQDEKGGFADATGKASSGAPVSEDVFGVWAADIEMDGDIDVVVGALDGPPFVLRNNGDSTWRRIQPFMGVAQVRAFAWADLDQDADPDAMFLDRVGALHVFTNRQAGLFSLAAPLSGVAGVVAATVADVDADGAIDVLALESKGSVRKVSWANAGWTSEQIATWPGFAGCRSRNGAADCRRPRQQRGARSARRSRPARRHIWLANQDHRLEPLPMMPEARSLRRRRSK